MVFCHGKGTPVGGHCCYVNGQVCPHYLSGADLTAIANSFTGARKTRALQMVQGINHGCKIAIKVIANNASLLNNRAAFNAAWDSDPEYLVTPRPTWIEVERVGSLPVGSYQCSTWGPGIGQCCFSEDAVTNESKASTLSSQAVAIRRAGGS